MEYSILTKKGTREINEDSVGASVTEQGSCFLLADGLGGHDRGEVASALAVNTGLEIFKEEKTEKFLPLCFEEGEKRLMQQQEKKRSEMKTTLTALLMTEQGKIQWGHVGDSRVYYFRNGKLIKHTFDHSVPQMLVWSGEIKEKDIRGHEDRNRLLRVMGIPWESPEYELSDEIARQEGQAFLLCSDGFWEWIEESQMVQALNQADSAKNWLERMEEVICEKAGTSEMDNYSAIAVFSGKNWKRKRLFGIF